MLQRCAHDHDLLNVVYLYDDRYTVVKDSQVFYFPYPLSRAQSYSTASLLSGWKDLAFHKEKGCLNDFPLEIL